METPHKMEWPDAERYMPGALGSLAYFLYMKIYQRLDWKRGLVALFTGVLVSAYLGPEVHSWVRRRSYNKTGPTCVSASGQLFFGG